MYERPLVNLHIIVVLSDLSPGAVIILLICLFITIVFAFIIIQKIIQLAFKKEEHRHDEVIHLHDSIAQNIKTICATPSSSSPEFKSILEQVLKTAVTEYEQNINGNLTPVRENKIFSRIWKRHTWKRS